MVELTLNRISDLFFISISRPELASDQPSHLVLFAQVMRGDSPVIGAKVMASVSLESTNNASVVTLSPVRLHDNGYGGEEMLKTS